MPLSRTTRLMCGNVGRVIGTVILATACIGLMTKCIYPRQNETLKETMEKDREERNTAPRSSSEHHVLNMASIEDSTVDKPVKFMTQQVNADQRLLNQETPESVSTIESAQVLSEESSSTPQSSISSSLQQPANGNLDEGIASHQSKESFAPKTKSTIQRSPGVNLTVTGRSKKGSTDDYAPENSKKLPSSRRSAKQESTFGFAAHQPVGIAPCGEVCRYGGTVVREEQKVYPWPQLLKNINCENIMKRMAFNNYEIPSTPPKYPPSDLLEEFTMFGDMPIVKQQYHLENWTAQAKYFTKTSIAYIINSMKKGNNINMYQDGICVQHTLAKYIDMIKDKHGFVVGTDLPWLEAMLLGLGARKVTTLEYAELHFENLELEAFTPYDFARKWLRGEIEPFEFGASFSSVEHSGLGRYTDPLNPYGDLESMAQSWCMVKPGGMFAIGVEDSRDGSNYILWNAHRVYGTKRLAQLTANWEVIEKVLCADVFQHNFIILQKPIV